jgi:hypothetical protein
MVVKALVNNLRTRLFFGHGFLPQHTCLHKAGSAAAQEALWP